MDNNNNIIRAYNVECANNINKKKKNNVNYPKTISDKSYIEIAKLLNDAYNIDCSGCLPFLIIELFTVNPHGIILNSRL